MHKSRQKPLYRRNIFFRGVHGLETKVRHCRSMVRLFTYRRFQKRSTSLLWLKFFPLTDDRYCGLRQRLSSVLRFHSPHRGHGSAFCLQGEFLYTCEQYPPCGGSVRCVARKHLYPTSLAVGSRQGAVPVVQRRHKICYRFKPLVCPLCGEEQHYIGKPRHTKSHQSAENMTRSAKKPSM